MQKWTLYSEKSVCDHCQNKNKIKAKRYACYESLKRQATKMLQTSENKNCKCLASGYTCNIGLPDLRKGKAGIFIKSSSVFVKFVACIFRKPGSF